MKVKELMRILKKLPSEMQVVMLKGESDLVTVCKENSEVIEVQVEATGENERALLLVPCTCMTDIAPEIIDEQLN